MKKAIAMKCDKEQFEVVKPKLLKNEIKISHSLSDFNNCPWLFNNWQNEDNFIGNSNSKNGMYGNREIHETWNEKIFLEACGIEVEELKEESFVITRDQIIILNTYGNKDVRKCMREWFSSAFEPEKKELVVDFTGWCKAQGIGNEKWIGFFENGIFQYGIGADGNWFFRAGLIHKFKITPSYYPTNQQEVEEALKAEAVRRGFKERVLIKELFKPNCGSLKQGYGKLECSDEDFIFNEFGLFVGNLCIFHAGTWATIIHPKKMTQAEIEKELGYNIEIV